MSINPLDLQSMQEFNQLHEQYNKINTPEKPCLFYRENEKTDSRIIASNDPQQNYRMMTFIERESHLNIKNYIIEKLREFASYQFKISAEAQKSFKKEFCKVLSNVSSYLEKELPNTKNFYQKAKLFLVVCSVAIVATCLLLSAFKTAVFLAIILGLLNLGLHIDEQTRALPHFNETERLLKAVQEFIKLQENAIDSSSYATFIKALDDIITPRVVKEVLSEIVTLVDVTPYSAGRPLRVYREDGALRISPA